MKQGIYIFLLALLFTSCKDKSNYKNKPDEGIITYNVSYFASEKDNPIIALLPNKVELRFKNNNISLTSEGYLGFFSTRFISVYNHEKSNILLKVLNKKLNYEFPQDQIAFIYNQTPPSKINYLDSTINVAGYKCKTAKLKFSDNSATSIQVAYTNKIGLKAPNRNTPLREIKGVLLEFETTMNHVRAKFTAQSVSMEKISDDEFTIPKDYVISDMETLKKYIVNFN